MNRYAIFLAGFLFLSLNHLSSQTIQSRKAWLAAADSALLRKDYYPAFKFYEAALVYDTTAVDVWFNYAESARKFNAYTFAEKGYLKVVELDKAPPDYPQARLWLASTRQKMGNYAAAKLDYEAYLANPMPGLMNLQDAARKGLSDCEWALGRLQPRGIAAPPRNLGPGINNEYSDFGASYRGDTIYYSSFRYQEGQESHKPQRPMIRVLRSDNGTEGLLLDDSFNIPGKHIGYSAFTPDNKGVYYAVCEYLNASDVRCDLYFRPVHGPGQWGAPLRLGINMAGTTSTQPAVGVEEYSGKPMLFFVSDRPGGKQGLDLWYGAILDNGDVQTAVNLEGLNTEGNDISPSFHTLSQQLFFSSDSRISLGGYDVYQAQLQKDLTWGAVRHLEASVNSSFDDVHYVQNEAGDKALFSSNRWGSTYIEPDKEACCYDIYEIQIELEVILDAFTFNHQDSSDLSGATVYVYEITPEGEKLVATKTNLDGNQYEFPLQRNKKYRVVAQKDDFIATEAIVDLTNLNPNTTRVRQDLYLDPLKVNLQALTFDAADMSALKGARVQLYEIVNGDTVLVADLANELGNDFNFTIGVNRPYLIKATKPGYDSLLVPFEVTTDDVRRLGRKITVELPLDADPVLILPIALYFDNGSPDGRSTLTTTKLEYATVNQSYYANKQIFIDKITEGMTGEQQFITAEAYENFFEREVKAGLRNLLVFSDQLLRYLQNGNSIAIELKGYASPRASAAFNEIISQRRIHCVRNFFSRYQDGAFAAYIKNGQFQIKEIAYGETQAKAGVPQRLDDIKGSIYSLRASLERRVEIVNISTQKANPK